MPLDDEEMTAWPQYITRMRRGQTPRDYDLQDDLVDPDNAGVYLEDVALSSMLSMIRSEPGSRHRRLIIFKADSVGKLAPFTMIADLETRGWHTEAELADLMLRVDDICLVFNGGHVTAQSHFDAVRISPEEWSRNDLQKWAMRVCDVAPGSANEDVLWRGLFETRAQSVVDYMGVDRDQMLGWLSAWQGAHGSLALAVTALDQARKRMYWWA